MSSPRVLTEREKKKRKSKVWSDPLTFDLYSLFLFTVMKQKRVSIPGLDADRLITIFQDRVLKKHTRSGKGT